MGKNRSRRDSHLDSPNGDESSPRTTSEVTQSGFDQSGDVENMISNIIDKFPEKGAEDTTETPKPLESEKDTKISRGDTLIQEVPVFVPHVEVVEVTKEVPLVEIEWVEKHVICPEYVYVNKYQEVPEVHYVPHHVPKYEIVEVPKEVIKHVPRIEIKHVEKSVHVPSGEKFERAVPYGVATEFVVPKFVDRKIPVIVSQKIVPQIVETRDVLEVDVCQYVPQPIHVHVFVPKPVHVPHKDLGIIHQQEIACQNPDPKLIQQLTVELNPHLQQLEEYNRVQSGIFHKLCVQSQEQSREHSVATLVPLSLPMMAIDSRTGAITRCEESATTSISNMKSASNQIYDQRAYFTAASMTRNMKVTQAYDDICQRKSVDSQITSQSNVTSRRSSEKASYRMTVTGHA